MLAPSAGNGKGRRAVALTGRRHSRTSRRTDSLVNGHGGQHHGYVLPIEGASDRALAQRSFPSIAVYERYRDLITMGP